MIITFLDFIFILFLIIIPLTVFLINISTTILYLIFGHYKLNRFLTYYLLIFGWLCVSELFMCKRPISMQLERLHIEINKKRAHE